MEPRIVHGLVFKRGFRIATALLCAALLVPGESPAWVVHQEAKAPPAAEVQQLPAEQLDSLVAPIALYPDPLLAQVLAASTYPLEIIQLQQWMDRHKDLKGQALTDAVMKEGWDPSVQAMVVLPDVVKRLANDIKWTAELGNAFLAQQSDPSLIVRANRHERPAVRRVTSPGTSGNDDSLSRSPRLGARRPD